MNLIFRSINNKLVHAKDWMINPPVITSLKSNKVHASFSILSGRNCNLSCPHCLTESGLSRKEMAKPEDAAKIIQNLKPRLVLGNCNLVISGGEPFLNLDFVSALVEEASFVLNGNLDIQNKIIIITNGSVFPNEEKFSLLRKMRGKIIVVYSDDYFHQADYITFSALLIKEKIEVVSMSSICPLIKPVGFGRGFNLETSSLDIGGCCEVSDLKYIHNGNSYYVSRPLFERNAKRFQIDEQGNLYLCAIGGKKIGNILEEKIDDIAKRIENDPLVMTLIQKGPLGLAKYFHHDSEAIDVYLNKGICGVCYYLGTKTK
ncbi:MAG: radical SAM protein [Candidatus Micrarchaeia archaeon]